MFLQREQAAARSRLSTQDSFLFLWNPPDGSAWDVPARLRSLTNSDWQFGACLSSSQRGTLKSKIVFNAPCMTVERRVQVVGSRLCCHFAITGGGEGKQTDGGGGEASEKERKPFFSPLGASQHYSADRSDREFYLSPWPICAVGLKFSLRKVFWIISAAILIQLLHHSVGANGGGSLSGVQSPSSSHLKWVHPEYTCCNGDIPRGVESKLSK